MDGEISGPELQTALDSDEKPLIVDIRNARQFERSHIPSSVNIPLAELPQRVETLRDADHVVTVCPHGQASVKAARLITSFEGFNGTVESLSCGITGWEGATEGDEMDAEESADAPF